MPRTRVLDCAKCGALKVVLSNGASRCLPCHNQLGRDYYERSELRRAKLRRNYVLRKYGATLEDLEQILREQGERCAICKKHWQECAPAKRPRHEMMFLHYLCVDHDHNSGRVRGLLCNACNTAIGLMNENITQLKAAIRYIIRHASG